MKTTGLVIFLLAALLAFMPGCKKDTTQVVDYSTYVATNNECRITGPVDSTQWINNILTRQQDTTLLTFADNIAITDTIAGPITVSPPCPNASNGFFIWNINPTRQCKLRLVCVNTSSDILYYNAYGLSGGQMTIGFDFRSTSTFHSGSSYRMYYGFYNAKDSCYFSGHGNFKIQ